MGNFKNKINNKKKKKAENAVINELVGLKKKMKEQYQAGQYVEAMDTMAELAELKKMDPEIMYMGASCYFMTGDYERAAKWINNTLSYDPQNIAARLLLARLCFVEDKSEDGFKILNNVVEAYAGGIRDEDNKTLMEMLEYCNDNMAEMMNNYPSVMEYFNKHYTAPKKDPSLSESAAADDGKSKAQAAVERLKALLNKSKGDKQEQATASETVPAAAPVPESTSAPIEAQETKITSDADNKADEHAEAIISKVMNSNISLREKIQSLNNFAGGMYINGDYAEAMALLKQALEIDANDPFVLKNIAFTCLAMGDKDKALEFASKLPMVEFGLLRAIKGHCHE